MSDVQTPPDPVVTNTQGALPLPAPAAAAAPVAQPPPTAHPPVVPAPIPDELGADNEDRNDGVKIAAETVSLPSSAFARVKTRTAEKARIKAEADMLKKLGVSSFEDVQEIVRKSKEITVADPVVPVPAAAAAPIAAPAAPAVPAAAPAPAPPPVAAPPAPDDRAIPEATRRALREQREAAEARAKAAEDQAAAAKLEVERIKAEREIREGFLIDGVQDVDFTYAQMQKHLATLDDAGLKAFDRAKWTAELKTTKPYLFRATTVPANTGTNGGAGTGTGGAPPQPGAVGELAAAAGTKDVRAMTDAERKAHYGASGIKLPPGSRVRKTG